MSIILDDEFGKITIRRNHKARQIKLRLLPNGSLGASLPTRAPIFLVKKLIKDSRAEIRDMIKSSKSSYELVNGQQIGKSHILIIQPCAQKELKISNQGQRIIIDLPDNLTLADKRVTEQVKQAVIKAIKNEAKSYLPKRLAFLANKYGYSYTKVRCSHAGGRWGSCSNNGTISLNIALMKLPFKLIDYVILHELSHTIEMNHGANFWKVVGENDPDYLKHKRELKLHNPSI